MNLRTIYLTTIVLTLISFNVSANYNLDLIGSYQVDNIAGAVFVHDWNITSENLQTGEFRGNGFYVPDPSVTSNITGTVTGNNFSDVVTYNNVPYFASESITINSDGSFQGTFSDSNGIHGIVNSVSGYANLVNVSSVPEPASIALLAVGFLGFGIYRRKPRLQAA